jgi:hypothetical protein
MKHYRSTEAMKAFQELVEKQIEAEIENATAADTTDRHMSISGNMFFTYPYPQASSIIAYEASGRADPHISHAQPVNFEDLRHGASAVQPISWDSSYISTLSVRTRSPSTSSVTGYEQTEHHQDRMMQMLIDALASFDRLGDGIDVFDVLPSFHDPQVDTSYLVRRCKSLIAHPQLHATYAQNIVH